MEEIDRHLRFKCPFTMMVCGPTGSGKTVFVRKLIKYHRLLLYPEKPTLRVLWCYGQWQNLYTQPVIGASISYNDGLPDMTEIKTTSPNIVVIDDLMNELGDNAQLGNLFTKGSHHMNISVIFITQNLYHKGKQIRNISLSCHYLILMKNPRDRSQIDVLARQMKLIKALPEAFRDATAKEYGYLVIDLKQDTPEKFMIRTRIFPDETFQNIFSPVVYFPK